MSRVGAADTRSQKGSLLLEAMLATVIMAVSLTVIIQSLSSSYRASVYSVEYTTACMLLENSMFSVIKDGYIKAADEQEGEFPSPFDKFRYRIVAGEAADRLTPPLFTEVAARVSWTSGLKKNSVAVTTYYFTLPE